MMDESQESLLNSLKSFGIELPLEISSVGEINPSSLFSMCTQSLRRLPLFSGKETSSYPTSLPDSVAERVRICNDVASALKNRGFVGDISSHKLLYPSEEDLYNLVRFLVKRLSEASSNSIPARASNSEGNRHGIVDVCSKITARHGELEFSGKKDVISVGLLNKGAHAVSGNISQTALLGPSLENVCTSKDPCGDDDIGKLTEAFRGLKQNDVQQQENQRDKCTGRVQGDSLILLNSLQLSNPVAAAKLQKLKGIELETASVLCELRNREEEFAKLTVELEKQPTTASRSSYVERVKEITKNSRKQDADIERISVDTRKLQLESNSVEERLHRSYAVLDEMVFREAKKDAVSSQAYKLLASIHGSFEEIREIILETDRTKREVADIESKLATIGSYSSGMEELQTDSNALKSENSCLGNPLL